MSSPLVAGMTKPVSATLWTKRRIPVTVRWEVFSLYMSEGRRPTGEPLRKE